MTTIQKDILQDIVRYTHKLGFIDTVKIKGTQTETGVFTATSDKKLVINGSLKNPVAGFIGTFGMPNLTKLNTILSFDDYDENSQITVQSKVENDENVPESILFKTKTGDFVNTYRFMSKSIIEDRIRNVSFKGATWNINFEPTVAGIMRLKKQHQANSEEESFTVKTENNDLKIYFGDPSSHSGNFVFQPSVTGSLTRAAMWPVKHFISIMDLPGNKMIYISNQGVMKITVDSGLTNYEYLLPAQSIPV